MAEVQEEIVLFELAGIPNTDLIKDKPCYLLGIESEEPMIQVGSLVFQGKYEDMLGTGLILEKQSDGSMQLICKSGKKVQMTRVPMKQYNSKEQQTTDINHNHSS